jgi:tetratricopeptide (TPR) repeat protein
MKLRWIGFLLLGIFLVSLAVFFWDRSASARRVESTLQVAGDLVEEGRLAEARVLIAATKAPRPGSPAYEEWVALEIAIAAGERRIPQLERLRSEYPEIFYSISAAVSLLARHDLQEAFRSGADLDEVVLAKELPLLEADRAILSGDPERARVLLRAAVVEGETEVDRLLRLALLESDDSVAAAGHLAKAYQLDPTRMEVRTFSANLLEMEGDFPAARREYVAALLIDPANARARDNLAEFYIRNGMIAQAVDTWMEGPPGPLTGIFELKAWFWNRVAAGGEDFVERPLRGALVSQLNSLPAHTFWGISSDALLRSAPQMAERPEIFWLRLLSTLAESRDLTALDFIGRASPRQIALDERLKSLIEAILINRSANLRRVPLEIPAELQAQHPFWSWLATNSGRPVELRRPWVIPVLLAVHGWLGAAADMADPAALGDAPEWVYFTLSRAAQMAGRAERQAAFLSATPSEAPSLRLLRAEAAWSENRVEEGLALLEALLTDSEVGFRAAFLLSLYYLDLGDSAAVRDVLSRNEDFAKAVAGREFLARSHLIDGNTAQAEVIYEALGNDSDEARVFLSKQAFRRQDWPRAEALTRSLIRDHPNEIAFLRNLEAIRSASAGDR